jgi:hypothetical protein
VNGILPPPPWNDFHCNVLAAFLKSDTGIALQTHFQLECITVNGLAVSEKTEVTPAFARGVKYAVDILISLATAHSGKTEQPADTDGTADPLAHLRP